MATMQIDEYYVLYSANTFAPRIALKKDSDFVGTLVFKANGATLPQDRMIGDHVMLFYHLDDFQNTIDLLRNEKPMYLFYNGSGPGYENGIRTTAEPIGEGELST